MKFAFSLIVMLFLGMSSFAQSQRASSVKKSQIAAAVQAGEFVFGVPGSVTTQQVKESAEYYTMYFTVEHLPKTSQVKITMKDNSSKGRHVIVRLLVSLDLQEIIVDDSVMTLEEYYVQFLN